MGVNSLPKTVTRQRRNCDFNPGPSAPESSTLTTRLPSHLTVCACINCTESGCRWRQRAACGLEIDGAGAAGARCADTGQHEGRSQRGPAGGRRDGRRHGDGRPHLRHSAARSTPRRGELTRLRALPARRTRQGTPSSAVRGHGPGQPWHQTCQKSVFSLVRSAVNMTLSAFAAERRAAAPLLLGARRCRSIFPARTALSSKPAARRRCGRMMGRADRQTDRQTDAQPLHRPCSAYYAGSVNNYRCTVK